MIKKAIGYLILLGIVFAFFGATRVQAGEFMVNVVLDKTRQQALINPCTRAVVAYNQLPVLGTHGVAVSPDGKYLYINAMPPGDIVEYDINKKGVSKWFAIKETTKNCGIQLAPDGKTIISASQNKKMVFLNRITGDYKVLDLPADTHQFAFSPDGSQVWAAGGKGNSVWVIDWKKRKLVSQFKVGKVPHGVTFSPDGSKVLVSLRGENRVAIFDAKPPHKEVGSIPIKVSEGGLCNIALMPDKKTYWLAETFGKRLWIIDAKTNKVASHIDVKGEPHHAMPVMMSAK